MWRVKSSNHKLVFLFFVVLSSIASAHGPEKPDEIAVSEPGYPSLERKQIPMHRLNAAKLFSIGGRKDNRCNPYACENLLPGEKTAMRAVGVVVFRNQLVHRERGVFRINGSRTKFCSQDVLDELRTRDRFDSEVDQFYNEPTPGFCSAFRTGKREITTAKHCAREVVCDRIAFVFGFDRPSHKLDNNIRRAPQDTVYDCKSVEVVGEVATVTVFRDIDDAIPTLRFVSSEEPDPDMNQKVRMVGHPSGLPIKITRDGRLHSVDRDVVLMHIDAFPGNSGSPVFLASELERRNPSVFAVHQQGANMDFPDDIKDEFGCAANYHCRNATDCPPHMSTRGYR